MAFEVVQLGYNVQTFKSSPKFELVDMVILNIGEDAYVSSPSVRVDNAAWEASSLGGQNGEFVFTYDSDIGSWTRNGSSVRLGDYGINATYSVSAAAVKAGDTITVNRLGESAENGNTPDIQIGVELVRTGKTIEADCPLCKPSNRQQIADNLLASLSSYSYQPFLATGAELNPLAELGDGISVNGVYGGLYQQDLTFDQMMCSDIGAPFEEEHESEYTYESTQERRYRRKFADIASDFQINWNEISAKVSREGTGNGFSWSLIESGFSVKTGEKVVFRVDKDGTYTEGTGKFSGQIVGGSIQIGSNFSVDENGNVSAVNANLSGTLTIGGTAITASVLRSGSQSAYTNGSTWTTGSGYGYNFNDMTNQEYTADWVCANHIVCYTGGSIQGKHYGYWADDTYSRFVSWKKLSIPYSVSVSISVDEQVYNSESGWIPRKLSASGSLNSTSYDLLGY